MAHKNTKSKKKATKPSKPKPKPAATKTSQSTRRLKQPQYQSLRLQKRIKHPVALPNVWRLTQTAAELFWKHRRLFGGVTLVYGLLNVVLAQSLSNGTDVTSLKESLSLAAQGQLSEVASSLNVFATLIGSAGNNTNQTAGAYQLFLAIIGSLAIIWALRQVMAGHSIRVRDAYYRGMSPLVPFILVLFVIGLQLVPLVIGSGLYSLVINNGIAVYPVEKFTWGLLFGLLGLLTLYMITSSIFALYIVTLPDMTPMKALRSARGLVRHRRWTVMRKVLFLPLLLLLIAAAIMLPIIIWLAPLARWVFFILTMSVLAAVHGYLYTLYRELLRE
jgi:hypothetical protein